MKITNPRILKYIEECKDVVRNLYPDYFKDGELTFEAVERIHNFGKCYWPTYLGGVCKIELNAYMFEEPEESIKSTILHELAHYIQYKKGIDADAYCHDYNHLKRSYNYNSAWSSHGQVWKETARRISLATGIELERVSSYDKHTGVAKAAQEHAKYLIKCMGCDHTWSYQKETRFIKELRSGEYEDHPHMRCPYCKGSAFEVEVR